MIRHWFNVAKTEILIQRLFVLLVCCFLYSAAAATDLDFKKIKTTYLAADSLNKIGEFQTALEKIKQLNPIEQFSESQKIWTILFDVYILKYKLYTNIRKNTSALRAILKAENIWEKHLKKEKKRPLTLLTEAYALKRDSNNYVQTSKLAWQTISSKNEVDSRSLAILYHAKGHYYQRIVLNVDKAIEAYSEALNILMRMKQPETATLGRVLRNLGNVTRSKADYEQALIFSQREIELYQNHYAADHFDISIAYYNMANINYELINFQEALEQYMKVVPVWEKKPPSKRYMRYLYEAIGDMNWELGNQEKALEYFDKSVLIEEKSNSPQAISDVEKGSTLSTKGAHDEAMKYYQKALSFREENFGKKHPMTGACHNFIAYTLRVKNQTEQALQAYHNSLIMLVEEFSDTSIYANPSLEMSFGWENYYLDALAAKGDLLATRFEESRSTKDLEVSFETFWLAIQVIDRIRQSPITENSKLFWTKKAFPIYETAIEVALQLHTLSKNNTYQNKAFEIAEKSKAFLLLSAIQGTDAAQFSNLPEELKEKEIALKSAIMDYQGKINREELRCAEAKIKMLKLWRNKLLSLQTEYDGFLNSLKENFPHYYDLKYTIETSSVQDLQKQLLSNKESALVEFFEGERNLYVFAIGKDSYQTFQVNLDSNYFQQIKAFRECLTNYEKAIEQPDLAYQQFVDAGFTLFNKLLKAPLKQLPQALKKIFIVPDGQLAYLPFECLLNLPVNEKARNYQRLPYLFKTYSISYGHSASLLQSVSLNKSTKKGKKLLAFAPKYHGEISSNRSTISNLFFNKVESQQVAKVFNGKVYLDEFATESNFKKEAPYANILHLAMHALVEDEHPILSKMLFSENDSISEEDGFLHTYELYNLNLKANLVMLSACNTGVGKWIRGEGMMSLARGFQYAGCPSIGTSLWTVDDQSTAILMKLFYENLKNKMPKDVALQQAKITYLAKADPAIAHPFFWGSFILIGDSNVIEWSSNVSNMLWLILGSLIFLGIFFSYKKWASSHVEN